MAAPLFYTGEFAVADGDDRGGRWTVQVRPRSGPPERFIQEAPARVMQPVDPYVLPDRLRSVVDFTMSIQGSVPIVHVVRR